MLVMPVRKSAVFGGLVVVAATLFSACTQAQPASTNLDSASDSAPAATEKQGSTTKTGLLTQQGDKFFLAESGQEPKEVNSYAVDLTEYVNQTVTVTGQYSGDTLYIGSVQMGES